MSKKNKPEIKLTPKEKVFADELIRTKNKTAAAKKAYPEATYSSQRSIGCRKATNVNINEYIKSCAPEAFNTVLEIMYKDKTPEAVRLNAAKDVLDRAGYKPKDSVEHSGQITMGMIVLPQRDIHGQDKLTDNQTESSS